MKIKMEFLLILLILLNFLIRLYTIHPTLSDENIYFSMAKNLSEGKILYKEIDFVHPPLQIYILAFLFKIFGVSLLTAKLLTLIASCLSVYLVFLIAKELFDKKIALLSAVLFLLEPSFLAFSDQVYGIW
jgi:4-amino-4-deoxy-L-arabinose transferase-like glycosyltransferase